MERKPHFLNQFVTELKEAGDYESDNKLGALWYNETGDCVMCLSANEGVIADRIDTYLTLFRSAIDQRVIGFQLKGIHGLMGEFEFSDAEVKARIDQGEIKAVMMLLFNSYRKNQTGAPREAEGYAEATSGLAALAGELV